MTVCPETGNGLPVGIRFDRELFCFPSRPILGCPQKSALLDSPEKFDGFGVADGLNSAVHFPLDEPEPKMSRDVFPQGEISRNPLIPVKSVTGADTFRPLFWIKTTQNFILQIA
jgi:hypothetical protein